MHRAELPRKLGVVDATAIVIGTVIGSAIFLVPASIARTLPSATIILLLWTLSGALSFFGALAYAELNLSRGQNRYWKRYQEPANELP
ncbi:MAG: amino acid permease [Syntrophobacteraceae bacterium]